jgi:predicted  nucleic acid-binding Zn-ribbon protein
MPDAAAALKLIGMFATSRSSFTQPLLLCLRMVSQGLAAEKLRLETDLGKLREELEKVRAELDQKLAAANQARAHAAQVQANLASLLTALG